MAIDRPTREQYDEIRRRSDAYAESNISLNRSVEELRADLDRAVADRARLERELLKLRETMQTVLTDNNHRYQKQNDEVDRLRRILKENEIEIGG
jgi:SMC interacting uncharacterized protein involved in chromosome segregation